MKIMPDDLLTRVFSIQMFGGYSKKEVSEFLEKMAGELEALLLERKDLIQKTREKEDSLREYKEREDLLRSAITTAQKTADDMREKARVSSNEIIQAAHQKADLIVQDARDSLKTVYQDLSDLRRVHIQLKNTLKAVLQSHQDLLEQDPIHTLLPQSGAGDDAIEDKVEKTLTELSKTKDLL